MSSARPVRNVQPGPAPYFSANAFNAAGVSFAGSMLIE